MEYPLLVFVHLLGAAVWTGGHLVLALGILPAALKQGDGASLREFEERFEPLGLPALALQVLTGLRLAYIHLPDLGSWFTLDSSASRCISLKFTLLGLTALLALHARLRLLPHLPHRLKALAAHIAAVTFLGVLFVLAGVACRTGGVLF